MKLLSRSLLLVACLLTFAGCPNPKPVPISPTGSLDIIARYPFDGNLLDSSGHHHHATASGPVQYGLDQLGRRNHALILNGTVRVTVPDTADLHFSDTSSFTISAWVRTRDTLDAGIVCKGPASNVVPGYCLSLTGGKPHAAITAIGTNVSLTGAESIADNFWHLVTLTVSPNEVDLYVDAFRVGQKLNAHVKPDSMNTGPLYIGGAADGAHLYNGYFDQIGIRNRAMDSLSVCGGDRNLIVNTISDLPPSIAIDTLSSDTTILAACWIDSANGYCCGTHGIIKKTTNGGGTWIYERGGIERLRSISFFNSTTGIAVGDNGFVLLRTGTGWSPTPLNIYSALSGISSITDIHISSVKFIDLSHAVIVGSKNGVSGSPGFVLILNTSTNTFTNATSTGVGALKCIGVSPFPAVNFWVAGEGGKILNYDANSYAQISQFTEGTSVFRSVDFSDPLNGVAGTDIGEIYTYVSPPSPLYWTLDHTIASNYVVGVKRTASKSVVISNDPGFNGFGTNKSGASWGAQIAITPAGQQVPVLFATGGAGSWSNRISYIQFQDPTSSVVWLTP